MNQPNPSLNRRWLQVDGLPLPAEIKAVRDEIDRVTHVEILPNSSRVILYAASEEGKPIGPVIGALDLMPDEKARIDGKAAAAAAAPAEKRTGGTDASRGDTIIRQLTPDHPNYLELLEGPRILHDPDQEPPPLELPGGGEIPVNQARELLDQLEPQPVNNKLLAGILVAILVAIVLLAITVANSGAQ